MTLLLVCGFLVVALAGVLLGYRGRRTAGLALLAGAVVGLVVSVLVAGREGAGEFTVGALAGLPVLLGGALVRDRRSAGAHLGPEQ